MNLGKRLATALNMVGKTPPQIARATGVPVASINALIRRDSKRSEFTEQMLDAIPADRVNHDWVRTGQGSPEPIKERLTHAGRKESIRLAEPPTMKDDSSSAAGAAEVPLRSWEHPTALPPGEWVFLPKLGFRLANPGVDMTITPVLMKEEIQAFRTGWIREDQFQPAMLAWHDATDDSMAPIIYKGDSFVVDTSATAVRDGKTYAVWFGNALRPRRLQLLPTGGIRVHPENSDFATVDIQAADIAALRIIGRIVHRSGKGGL